MTSGHFVERRHRAVEFDPQQRSRVLESGRQPAEVGFHRSPDRARAQVRYAVRVLPSDGKLIMFIYIFMSRGNLHRLCSNSMGRVFVSVCVSSPQYALGPRGNCGSSPLTLRGGCAQQWDGWDDDDDGTHI